MAKYLKRAEGIAVSHNFIAQVWRDHDLQPQRLGTFKLSNDPEFEAKVADPRLWVPRTVSGSLISAFDAGRRRRPRQAQHDRSLWPSDSST
jgi:hypothetical protein